jgi:hypothetical protein
MGQSTSVADGSDDWAAALQDYAERDICSTKTKGSKKKSKTKRIKMQYKPKKKNTIRKTKTC